MYSFIEMCMIFFLFFQVIVGSYEGLDIDSFDFFVFSCDEVSDNESIVGEEDFDVWSDILEDYFF